MPDGSKVEETVKAFTDEFGWTGRLIVVTEKDNKHFDAMCGADVGVIYDGQMVGSAAALHLPTMVLYNMKKHHQFIHHQTNRWWNTMNVIADCDIYPELVGGEAWFGKIAETLGEWYLKPGKRWDMVRQWEFFLKDSLSRRAPDMLTQGEEALVLADGHKYEAFNDPMQ